MNADARDLETADRALIAAMEVVRSHARTDVPFEWKDGHSLVTAADREVDELLRRTVPSPGDGWLSEERDDDGSRHRSRRVWIVDPLDGTRSFVAGRADHSVSIGLVVDGEPVLGAIGASAIGVRVVGGLGLGVRVHGDPRLPWPPADGRLRVLASRSETKRGEWARWQGGACHLLPVGSVAWKLALVAAGIADATWTWNGKNEWDVAAGAALVAAAGGDVWRPDGGVVSWNRPRARFPSFAAAGPGLRAHVASLSGSR
ncbi:MAG: 3'(2'),5'-bisphosphate nucleotidase CysQ [Planctomycetes bacterium]|nr:3'(2'),5'-bisphosphate nucleotidase CysQ [Planctomycetota bacterium]